MISCPIPLVPVMMGMGVGCPPVSKKGLDGCHRSSLNMMVPIRYDHSMIRVMCLKSPKDTGLIRNIY